MFIHSYYTRSIVTNQWEFQDPKREVLYHIRPFFMGIFPYIGLNFIGQTYMVGTSNKSVPDAWPLNQRSNHS
jgi:hypothetical protein